MQADFAEAQEEHQENQYRLQEIHCPVDKGARGRQKGDIDIDEITCHPA